MTCIMKFIVEWANINVCLSSPTYEAHSYCDYLFSYSEIILSKNLWLKKLYALNAKSCRIENINLF